MTMNINAALFPTMPLNLSLPPQAPRPVGNNGLVAPTAYNGSQQGLFGLGAGPQGMQNYPTAQMPYRM